MHLTFVRGIVLARRFSEGQLCMGKNAKLSPPSRVSICLSMVDSGIHWFMPSLAAAPSGGEGLMFNQIFWKLQDQRTELGWEGRQALLGHSRMQPGD